jgi:hypothetical protein
MGLSGQNPLWKTLGGHVTRDHQLLTHTPTPRGNVLGPFGGAKLVRGASRGLFVIGAGLDVYNIATADNKVEEGVKVASGWGGAWAGAKGGAAVGATIGSFFGPGPGTAIGGVVGGAVGGIGGYVAGYEIGDEIYAFGRDAVKGAGDVIDGAKDLATDAVDTIVSSVFD